MLILLALQSTSAGSVPSNVGTLGAEMRKLKPSVAVPVIIWDKTI